MAQTLIMDTHVTTNDGPSMGRRSLLKMTGAAVVAAGVSSVTGTPAKAQCAEVWDKTFPRNPAVEHRKLSYVNRLGIRLVADLYTPAQIDPNRRYAALVSGHPYGGVKEQSSGLYAQELAARGFVTLAHDASYNGQSGGQPHFISSPEASVEDFSAGVDFLGTHDLVDRDRIGICGSGGFALAAAQIDPRMKAVATVSMYDMGGAKWAWGGIPMDEKARIAALTEMAEQRWSEAEGAAPHYGALPEKLNTDTDDFDALGYPARCDFGADAADLRRRGQCA